MLKYEYIFETQNTNMSSINVQIKKKNSMILKCEFQKRSQFLEINKFQWQLIVKWPWILWNLKFILFIYSFSKITLI